MLLVTPYGVVAALTDVSWLPTLRVAANVVLIAAGRFSGFFARGMTLPREVGLAILFPLIATPYALFYDVLLAAPALALLRPAWGVALHAASVLAFALILATMLPAAALLPLAAAVGVLMK